MAFRVCEACWVLWSGLRVREVAILWKVVFDKRKAGSAG